MVPAVLIELAFSFVVLFVPPVARLLGQWNPPLWGWMVALSSMPILLAVDALDKHLRARHRRRSASSGSPEVGHSKVLSVKVF
ncbi:hypothetical protein B1T50_04315 [Mycobacterium kansasii]|nr:hypothetical protein B1T50_04315 [Mycobacterium kansasii]